MTVGPGRRQRRAALSGVAMAVGVGTMAIVALTGAADVTGLHARVHRASSVIDPGAAEPWRAVVEPPAERTRVEVLLDGRPLEGAQVEPAGDLSVDLSGETPGYHQLELRTVRRGGRVARVVNSVLVGPYASASAEEPRCGLTVQVSAEALGRVLTPVLRARLREAARGSELLGAETKIDQAEVELVRGGAKFRVALAGVNRVAVSGQLELGPNDARHFKARLVSLGEVEFTGELRIKATVGGAAVGAVVTGPLAPVGAVAGYVIVDRYIAKRAREEVQARIEAALRKVKGFALIPARAELIPGEARSEVALGLCEQFVIDPALGVAGGVSIVPVDHAESDAPGYVDHGVELPAFAALPGEGRHDPERADVQIDLSVDTVNSLLHAWTTTGLVRDRVAASRLLPRANDALAEWTTLQLRSLFPRLPPVLAPPGEGAPAGAWALGLGDLELELDVRETPAATQGAVIVGGRGQVWPAYDKESGMVQLGARVDALWLGCEVEPDDTFVRSMAAPFVQREPCFGSMLEVATFDERLDEALAPGAGGLPSFDVRGLVRDRSESLRPGGLELADLWIEHPEGAPGVLRVRARLDTLRRRAR